MHAAAGNGHTDAARLLMLGYGADGMRCNELNETPKDTAVSKNLHECASAIDLCIRANMLRATETSSWYVCMKRDQSMHTFVCLVAFMLTLSACEQGSSSYARLSHDGESGDDRDNGEE